MRQVLVILHVPVNVMIYVRSQSNDD